MIIWLASYPRSGNSLIRSLISQVFGIGTYSQYNDVLDLGSTKERARLVEHLSYRTSWSEFCEMAAAASKPYFVKTHEPPRDDAKAIYIIRDGRSTIDSYYHYLNQFGDNPISVMDVILGTVPFGSWSEHIDHWAPEQRELTLLLRFEDVLAQPDKAVAAISEFTGLRARGRYAERFQELHAQFPQFFRSGDNKKNISDLTRSDLALFQALHGKTAIAFGYMRSARMSVVHLRQPLQALRDQVRELKDCQASDQKLAREARVLKKVLAEKSGALSHQEKVSEIRNGKIEALGAEIASLKKALAEKSGALSHQEKVSEIRSGKIEALGAEIASLKKALSERAAADNPGSYLSPTETAEMEDLGIAIFGHTRATLIHNTLESLRQQGAMGLVHVWMDGDQGNPVKKKNVERALEVVSAFNVRKIHRHRGNLGFRKIMLHAMYYMSERYKNILFLEDDCFPTKNYVSVFSRDLKTIREDGHIFSVYGSHFMLPNEGSAFTRFQGWGWGTTSNKLKSVLDDLTQCYLMTEEQYLSFTKEALTAEILDVIDVTPGRQPSLTLKSFFAWDETLCLLTALRGLKHQKSSERVVFNCGVGEDSTHFKNIEFYRKPPFNMITPDEVWDFY